MPSLNWSRRDLLKSVGTGAVAVTTGASIYQRLSKYVVGTVSDDGATAASAVSDTTPRTIDLTEHTPWQLVRGTFSDARIESLDGRGDVAFVQPDRWLETQPEPTQSGNATGEPWGVDRIGASDAHEKGYTAAGIDIGAIDSGIKSTHPAVESNIAPPGDDDAHKAWIECAGNQCPHGWSDDSGHGTHVSGIAAASIGAETPGVAPEATLHALKVCGGSGRCRTSAVAEAVRYAADQDWDVVNLSLGSPNRSPALQAAGEYALESGVVPVAAVGNRGGVKYPAVYNEFLGVAATNDEDEIAGFSSTGDGVDVAAPGVDIYAPVLDGYETQSGTSMAAPHASGTVAQVIANGVPPTEAATRVIETAEDLGHSPNQQGAGLVDVAAALGTDSDADTVNSVRPKTASL